MPINVQNFTLMLLDCDMKITDQSKLCCSTSVEIKEDGEDSRVKRTFCIIYFDRRGGRGRGEEGREKRAGEGRFSNSVNVQVTNQTNQIVGYVFCSSLSLFFSPSY